MDSILLVSDKFTLFTRTSDGRFNQISTIRPRDPASLQDVQLAPDGRQLLAICSNPEYGVCFACLSKGQDRWLYYDYFPSEFRVTCGVFSPTRSHIVYLGTTRGGIVQFDLKTKNSTFLTRGRDTFGWPVISIDANAVGSHVAAAVGGTILVHSLRNKIDTVIDYDPTQNGRVLLRFHPTQQFALGVFSKEEGAAVLDLSTTASQTASSSTRWRAPPGEAHVCEPYTLLWAGTSALISVATDRRVVQYSSKGCGQLYRHDTHVASAAMLREGAELLLGLSDGLACLDIRQRKMLWTKETGFTRAIYMMARAKPHLPVARESSEVESMYPQKEPDNPENRLKFCTLRVTPVSRDSTCIISPLRGDENQVFSDDTIKRRGSALGSLISPPRGCTSHRKKEMQVSDSERQHILHSTVIHDSDEFSQGNVDIGMDSTSPQKSKRHPVALKQLMGSSGQCPTPLGASAEKILFCNVDRLRASPNIDQTSSITASLERQNTLLERQNTLLEQQSSLLQTLVEATGRLEKTMSSMSEDVGYQGSTTRILVEHALHLQKAHHKQTTEILAALIEAQESAWLHVAEGVDASLISKKI
ncbi:hypothetical protein BIW11_04265 [Tropilaelaps mercedesae]|uniref:Uncharacterized protein n=1 Tax=Tropilaelaps mercedesae TaxID=418985 RepID=A0A1V9X8K2_9ACAR|nr:hypothetical protein BIW11_04265 [Tropilaelaps mercedesae]